LASFQIPDGKFFPAVDRPPRSPNCLKTFRTSPQMVSPTIRLPVPLPGCIPPFHFFKVLELFFFFSKLFGFPRDLFYLPENSIASSLDPGTKRSPYRTLCVLLATVSHCCSSLHSPPPGHSEGSLKSSLFRGSPRFLSSPAAPDTSPFTVHPQECVTWSKDL